MWIPPSSSASAPKAMAVFAAAAARKAKPRRRAVVVVGLVMVVIASPLTLTRNPNGRLGCMLKSRREWRGAGPLARRRRAAGVDQPGEGPAHAAGRAREPAAAGRRPDAAGLHDPGPPLGRPGGKPAD